MPTLEQHRTCSICGAIIGENNPDGIGGQCRKVYYQARYSIFFKDKKRIAAYCLIENKPLMENFIKFYGKTKFRSAFRKSFFPSIIKQYKEKHFLTKKQKEIILGWLDYITDWRIKHEELYSYIEGCQKEMIRNCKFSDNEKEAIVKLANWYRHQ